MKNYFFTIIFLFTSISLAQANKTVVKNTPKKIKYVSFYRSNFGAVFWTEEMKATKAGVKDLMVMQLNGFTGGLSYNIPWIPPRLSYFYQFDLSFGTVKGKGNGTTNLDEINNQTWAALSIAPGLLYKINQEGEVGLSTPVIYRYLDWKLQGTDLEIDKSNNFSYGLAFLYNHHVNNRHSAQFAMNYQEKWTTSLLSLKWQYSF